VGTQGWTTFLAKGESSQVLQNRPDMLTGFELALLELALSQPEREVRKLPLSLSERSFHSNACGFLEAS